MIGFLGAIATALVAQIGNGSPSGEEVRTFADALVYADSLALASGVMCLLIAIVFQFATLTGRPTRHIKELVSAAIVFGLIGNTAVANVYPEAAVVKAAGYLIGLSLLTWRFGRLYERHREVDGR